MDLPGYGYARVSKKAKKEFQKFITDYFEKREQLVSAFVLIDCRHDPQPIDLEFMEYLGESQIPFSIIFTKADKLKPQALARNIEDYKAKLLEGAWMEVPNYFISSSSHGDGRDDILNYIGDINKQIAAD